MACCQQGRRPCLASCPLLLKPNLPLCLPHNPVHWGSNWGYSVPGEQRAFAHALIDQGEQAALARQAA